MCQFLLDWVNKKNRNQAFPFTQIRGKKIKILPPHILSPHPPKNEPKNQTRNSPEHVTLLQVLRV